jgi:hypothetical protein
MERRIDSSPGPSIGSTARAYSLTTLFPGILEPEQRLSIDGLGMR